ncbi:MAG: hypothetical protein WCJ09_15080 [Planctomycetota bacterium]
MSKAIRNPYFTACGVCLALVAILLTIGSLTVAFLSQENAKPSELLIAIAFFSFVIAFGLLVGTVMLGLMTRRVGRYIRFIQNENYLVRWSYRPEEWDAFQRAEFPLIEQDFRKIILIPTLISIPFGLAVFVGAIWLGNADRRGVIISGIATCVFFAAALAAAYYIRVVRQRSWIQKQRLSPPETYIHSEFVYANGEFLLGLGNQRLIEIEVMLEEPPRIKFAVEGEAPRSGKTLEIRRVLIPAGQLDRAKELVASIQADWHLV